MIGKTMKGKFLGIVVVCFLLLGLSIAGGVTPPAIASADPSVSIDPATQTASAGGTFTIDVLVDAGTYSLLGCDVAVSYDSTAMSTSAAQITEHNLLTGMEIGPTVTDGVVSYAIAATTAVSGVSASLMTIEFTVSGTASAGTYNLTISKADLNDENNVPVPGVVTNDGTVTIGVEVASVSIDPATKTASAGGTFTIDVLVDAGTYSLLGCDVAVSYDSTAMSTSAAQITAHNLLTGMEIGPTVTDGEVSYAIAATTAVSDVSASLMTIEFTVSGTASAGTYNLTISKADLNDENNVPVPGVVTNDGTVTIDVEVASVSIDPATKTALVGGTFTIDVLVDAGTYSLLGCDVAVSYDSTAMSTSDAQITEHNLLSGMEIGPTVTDGEVRYAIAATTAVSDVSASLMTIEFTVSGTASADTYNLTITRADLSDENNVPVPGVVTNDGTVTISVEFPELSASVAPTSPTTTVGSPVDYIVTVTNTGTADATNVDVIASSAYNITFTHPATQNIAMGASADFTVSATPNVEGTDMSINFAVTCDEGVSTSTSATLTVSEEVVVELEFSGSLAKGERETLLTPDIPAGATDLAIVLTATADIDLELYYGDTLVIGWGGAIDSAAGGTYQDDTFAYSGYDGGEEYITAAGPLSRAYTLKVYGYKAGDYEVTVSYILGVPPDVTPPEITITAPDATVGVSATITVSATDPSGVNYVCFGVWTVGASADWNQAFIMGMGPGGEVSVTFTPFTEFAGTYTIMAWAGDTEGNWTPDAAPETATWVVTE